MTTQPQRGPGEIEVTPMTLREAALELADSCEEARNYLLQHVQSGYPVAAFNIVRADYVANHPEPLATPSLWRAARALFEETASTCSSHGIPPCEDCWETLYEPSLRSLRVALDATPEPVAAITEEDVATAFRDGEVAWYLEHAPHIGIQCASMLDMNERAKAASIAGACAVLKRLAGRA